MASAALGPISISTVTGIILKSLGFVESTPEGMLKSMSAISLALVGCMFAAAALLSLLVVVTKVVAVVRWTRCEQNSADRALGVASFVAGPSRSHLRDEWASMLAGDPDNGIRLSRGRRMRYILGFMWAALRMRARDLTGPLWVPVDWLLSTESRTNRFIALAVGAQAVYVVDGGGIPALVTEIWEPCALFGGALYILARWLRRVRGIELSAAADRREE
ncbi:hypothetical protein ACIBM4_21465 [Streptomyces sp. NPDC050256]|uniref:hypothetical protein n=1 Tax=Streptomyces sp. NPDC050256 TaxID=3365607 RepID=UPI0037A04DCC